jgi:hypothetical protein
MVLVPPSPRIKSNVALSSSIVDVVTDGAGTIDALLFQG